MSEFIIPHSGIKVIVVKIKAVNAFEIIKF